ncbi:uncharacterized protein LOC113147479, partial [Cyclospora cayetanensis]|uniref:Uncharacterized protein LOC113147479 n=1 Tax=Cyclospora cayetanensis TaxID=88456 RepID=A0A6P6S1J6_9EIME
ADASAAAASTSRFSRRSSAMQRQAELPAMPASPLSLSEALYLSKEAGCFTVKELQKIVLTSPSFSSDSSPFLLENMFSSLAAPPEKEGPMMEFGEGIDDDDDVAAAAAEEEEAGMNCALLQCTCLVLRAATRDAAVGAVDRVLRAHVHNCFDPEKRKTFEHGGRVWLCRAEGRGTRKRAAAVAVLTRGTGQVRVCGREEVYTRWPYVYNRIEALQPLYIAGVAGIFDVDIHVKGGGPSGQAAATRLAIGRALVEACSDCQPELQEAMVLYEDTRQRMPKMPGRMKARKQRQWSKR